MQVCLRHQCDEVTSHHQDDEDDLVVNVTKMLGKYAAIATMGFHSMPGEISHRLNSCCSFDQTQRRTAPASNICYSKITQILLTKLQAITGKVLEHCFREVHKHVVRELMW